MWNICNDKRPGTFSVPGRFFTRSFVAQFPVASAVR